MFTCFFFLILLTGGVCSEPVCSYQDVLNYLNLTKENELYFMTRPVKDHRQPTVVNLDVSLYAILDVDEKEQKFIPYVWVDMVSSLNGKRSFIIPSYLEQPGRLWTNEYISWDPNKFCGITNFSIPAEAMWQPDITIVEMTERDKAPPSPYLIISYNGLIQVLNDLVLVSTCRMNIHKFPFDIQTCTLTFKSLTHFSEQLHLQTSQNYSEALNLVTQYEWLFLEMTIDDVDSKLIIYTISMKRRPMLYSANFLLPVFFFLCLDLASFLISDTGGEKIGFKVTILLAVTVLQLILNEILPASSDRIPLIAMYCIGIFGLMLLSLLETILVMYLMEKDRDQSLNEDSEDKQDKSSIHICDSVNKWTRYSCVCGVSSGDKSPELLSVEKEDSSGKEKEECDVLVKLSDELHELEKTLTLFLNNTKEAGKPGKWTRLAKKINQGFCIFYVVVVTLFLTYLVIQWNEV